jgi:hypothetical protein
MCREKRIVHRFSVGKPQGRRPLGKLGSICKNSCKMDLREIGWECVAWIYVAQYGNTEAVWNMVMNPHVPKDEELVYQLRNRSLLDKNCALWS